MKFFSLIFTALLLLFLGEVSSTVIGIDFGSANYKIVLVQGRDFTLVLNEQSSRKTKNVIAFRDNNRYFGSQAENVGRLAPRNNYNYLRNFLGKSMKGAEENLKYLYYAEKVSEEQGAFKNGTLTDFTYLIVNLNENEKLAVHEMVAMILNQAQKMAEKAAGIPVLDCVITVPVYFTQNQRLALMQAASMAGLTVLSLMNDNTAYALKYAIDRPLPADKEEETVLFYNHGESSLQLSLVQFEKTRNKKDAIIPVIKVISSVWSNGLGTREFDYRLSELFAKKINDKHKVKIQENLRAMVKLNGELTKAREVLSANKESAFLIEGLTPEIDFGDKLTRDQFESMNEDLFSQIPLLIDSLIQTSNISKENINSIEMVGGAIRIPKIQDIVKKYFGRETLDYHINADEGAAFGAAFYAAGLSVHHRVKEMKLKDITPWKVAINISDSQDDSSLEIIQESDDDETLDKFATLFRRGNRYGSRKTLSFYTTRPFKIELSYDDDLLPPGTNTLLETFYFDNLPTPEQYNFTGKPKVYIQFQLSTSGVIELIKAEAEITVTEYVTKRIPIKPVVQPEEPKPTEDDTSKETSTEPETTNENQETTESKEGDQESTEDDQKSTEPVEEPTEQSTEPVEEPTQSETSTEQSQDSSSEPTSVVSEEPPDVVEIEEITKTQRINLQVSSVNANKIPTQLFKRSSKTLKEYEDKDKLRYETENAKNDLESFIYDVKDKLYDEIVMQFSNEEERQTLSDTMTLAGEWLYENQNANLDVYTDKKTELLAAVDVIYSRIREYFQKLMDEQKAKEEAEKQAQEALKKAQEAEKKAQEAAQKESEKPQTEQTPEPPENYEPDTSETPTEEPTTQQPATEKGDL